MFQLQRSTILYFTKLINDDIKKIQGVVQKVVDTRAEKTELKMELRFSAVEKQMEQDRHDWSGFFNEARIFFDQLVKRIKKLEDNKRIFKS